MRRHVAGGHPRRRARAGEGVMGILIDQNTRLLCQGMTGWAGTYHTNRMIQYGTKVVAGVTPGKGGKSHLDVPVFDHVAEAMGATAANASAIFVPPDRAAEAMLEAIEAEMPLVVVVTERIPVLDMIRVREALAGSRTRLIGPNSQGILAPDVCQIGVMATDRAQARHHRRRLALGLADQRNHEPAHRRRSRPIDHHRHRRRSGARPGLCRLPGAVLRRSANRRHRADRRDRRRPKSRRRRDICATPASRSRWSLASSGGPRRRSAAWDMPAR